MPAKCKDVMTYIKEAKIVVKQLELMRGGEVGSQFDLYLDSHKDIFIKMLYIKTKFDNNAYENLKTCEFGKESSPKVG